jgi:hypothetical protein
MIEVVQQLTPQDRLLAGVEAVAAYAAVGLFVLMALYWLLRELLRGFLGLFR